ncbi:MAG: hypothetical protein ABFD46_06985 [Armatimonadota bacterium]
MKEIITQEQVEVILKIVAVSAPAAGLVIGAIVGLIRKRIVGGSVIGVIIGFTGTVVFGLWRMYTAVGEHFGYTNTVCIAIQLAVFTVIGICAGFAIQRSYSIKSLCEGTESSREKSFNASEDL